MFWMFSTAFAIPTLEFVTDSGVRYSEVESHVEFQQWIESLTTIGVPPSPNAEKAFWINVYNGLTIDTVADAYPISSIRDLDGGKIWTTRSFTVNNQSITLDNIEKIRLAKFKDPRIHAALNCAAKGCPTLLSAPYDAKILDQQLNSASQQWIRENGVRWETGWFGNTLYLNRIFDWYATDFPCTEALPVPAFVPKKYCGAIQFIAEHNIEYRDILYSNTYSIELIEYDWSLNDVR